VNSQLKKCVLGVILVVVGTVVCIATEAKTKPKPKSLLTVLSEWKYPKSEFHGAETSDGQIEGIVSSNCKFVVTTKDSFEKVTDFYEQLLEASKREKEVNTRFPQSVLVNDCSKDRDNKVRVFLVNTKDTATSIVVSRGKEEAKTHIAWSHFVRH